MALVTIKLPGETLELTLSNEQAEAIVQWFSDAPADDVANATDPDLGDFWVQKRHITRLIVRKD